MAVSCTFCLERPPHSCPSGKFPLPLAIPSPNLPTFPSLSESSKLTRPFSFVFLNLCIPEPDPRKSASSMNTYTDGHMRVQPHLFCCPPAPASLGSPLLSPLLVSSPPPETSPTLISSPNPAGPPGTSWLSWGLQTKAIPPLSVPDSFLVCTSGPCLTASYEKRCTLALQVLCPAIFVSHTRSQGIELGSGSPGHCERVKTNFSAGAQPGLLEL